MPTNDCYDKATEIQRRTGILLGLQTHNIISTLCLQWGCQNKDEFFLKMKSMSDSELKSWVEGAKQRVRAKKAYKEAIAYA